MNLFLFDVDGTLVELSSNPLHKNAFSHAFSKVYDIETSVEIINTMGMTDREIIYNVLKKNSFSDDEIFSKMDKAIEEMASYFEKNIQNESIAVIKGVEETLDYMKDKAVLGLLTGNIERIAKAKLRRAGLLHYFPVGAFGSDAFHRHELVSVALKRCESKPEEIYVIGDTPKDVEAAKKANVKSIAVSTGIYSLDELAAFSPDYLFEDLTKMIEFF